MLFHPLISHREIARPLEINRKTVGLIAKGLSKRAMVATDVEPIDGSKSCGVATDCGGVAANAPTPATEVSSSSEQNGPGWPPTSRSSMSACEPHREWIEDQVRLGRNAMSIYRDLVDRHGFGNTITLAERHWQKLPN